MSRPISSTIYDVIDNFWGRDPLKKVMRSDKIALSRFGREVNRFYDSYEPTSTRDGELRTYWGGLVAVNFSLTGKQTTFFNNLLYSHSTIVPDPIARWYFDRYEQLAKMPSAIYKNGQAEVDQSEWIGWILNSNRAFQWNLQACREVLSYFISGLLNLRPLVEAGIVVLVSQAHILLDKGESIVQEALVDADNANFRASLIGIDEQLPLWDNLRGGVMKPSAQGVETDLDITRWAQAKEAAYHMRKNLAIADSTGGRYVPENHTDHRLLGCILRRSFEQEGYENIELQVAHSMNELRVPSLEGLPLRELIAIRKDELAFEDFRIWLARRMFSSSSGTATNAAVVLTGAEFENELAKLRAGLSSANTIKEHIRQDGLKIVVNALFGIASGAAIGVPLAGAAAGCLAGIASALISRDRSAHSVTAKLALMNRVAADATFGMCGKPQGTPLALSTPFFGEFSFGPKLVSFPGYTPAHLREIVSQSLQPNTTQNPFKAITARQH